MVQRRDRRKSNSQNGISKIRKDSKKSFKEDPPNPDGRPKLKNQTFLTPEMEDVAQLIRAGYEASQVAEELNIPTEKVHMYLTETPIVISRIKNLFGDKLERFSLLRDKLYETSMEQMIKLIREGAIQPGQLEKIMIRYDPYENELKGNSTNSEIKSTTQISNTKDNKTSSMLTEMTLEEDEINSEE